MQNQSHDDVTAASGSETTHQFYARHTSERGPRRSIADPNRNRLFAFLLIGLGLALLLDNFGWLPSRWGSQSDTTTYGVEVPLDDVETAEVRVDWGSGNLQMISSGGSGDLVRGSVEARGEPIIEDERDEEHAEVTISDRRRGWLFGASAGASGTLLLDPTPEYQFDFDLGSGSSELDLADLHVSELELDAGSGSVDLRLPANGDAQVVVDAGSGSLRIAVPPETAARIVLDRGSGHFSHSRRFSPVEGNGDDQVFETAGYDSATSKIDIEIDGGSGSIAVR